MTDGAQETALDPWERLDSLVRSFRANMQRATGARVSSVGFRTAGKELVQHYFRIARPELEALALDVEELDALMQGLLEATNGRALRKTYLSLLARIRTSMAELEGKREIGLGQRRATQAAAALPALAVTPGPSEMETMIIGALERLVPSAALSYRQALVDLSNPRRISFRGPANELREALREVIDELAPDEDVMAVKGFRLEPNQTTPTRKQKVRYILRSRGISGTARQTPERAVVLIEEMVASFAASAYDRSNVSAHVASARRDVQQMKMYVESVLAELLQVHD